MVHSKRFSSKHWMLVTALILAASTGLSAQQSPFTASMRASLIEPVQPSPFVHQVEPAGRDHRFWDRDNRILFAAVGAASTADFFVTRANLASGGRELNPVANMFSGSTAGLAVNFAGETIGSIGVSYLFHKTGHHKLERITSFVNIGASAGAVGWGLSHR
jgi:hypothetical protein